MSAIFVIELLALFLSAAAYSIYFILFLGIAFFLLQLYVIPHIVSSFAGIRYIDSRKHPELHAAARKIATSFSITKLDLGVTKYRKPKVFILRKTRNNMTLVINEELLRNPNKGVVVRAFKKEIEAQGAMEYLITYGWAILIIAIALAALFGLRIINYGGESCIAQPGFLCSSLTFRGSGLLTLQLAEYTFQQIKIVGVACTPGSSAPSNLDFIGLNFDSLSNNQQIAIGAVCPISSGNLGTTFSGSLWIEFSIPSYPNLIEQVGTLSVTAQQPALSANFSGKRGSFISVPSAQSLSVGDPGFTFSAWVNLKAYPTGPQTGHGFPLAGIIFEREPAYGWGVNSTGWLNWIVSVPGRAEPTNAYVPLKTITNLVITDNGTSIAAYENGVLVSTFNGVNQVNNPAASTLVMGARNASGTPYTFLNGSLVNVQIYSTALNASQVAQLYSRGLYGGPLPSAGIVSWWPLSGDAKDYSGTGNNGSPSNIIWSPP